MLQSGLGGGRATRALSFSRTLVLLATNWVASAARGLNAALIELGTRQPLEELVGHRPNRVEPRVNKRRPKILKLMTKPRSQYQAELEVAA